jgi:hypothetical protein
MVSEGGGYGRDMHYACEILTMRTKFWCENLKGIQHLQHLCLDNRIILK